MRMRLLAVVVAWLLVGAADPAPDMGEVAERQVIPPGSRWLRTDADGHTFVEEFRKDGWWEVTALLPSGEIPLVPVKYRSNPNSSPPHIDIVLGRARLPGIYRLEGDRLLICIGEKGRPTSFTHRPKVGQQLSILKRLK